MTRAAEAPTVHLAGPTRRHLLRTGGLGLGGLALASLLDPALAQAAQIRARARRVVFLFMAGGPSQIDLFDPKPRLDALDGSDLPDSVRAGERFAFIKGTPRLLRSPFRFARHGKSGVQLSELLPHLARQIDHVALVRSVQTSQVNHAPAQIFMNTGHQLVGRPSFGAWLSYGLGAANRDLPSFVALFSGERRPDGGRACWGSGFLPSFHQAVELRASGDPVLFLADPPGVTRPARRDSLDTLAQIDGARLARTGHAAIRASLRNHELAFRMQTAVPELADLASEPPAVHTRYGTTPGRASFANNCLLARRLLERGCRFVQLFHRGWDTHGVNRSDDLSHRLPALCAETDQPSCALLMDLRERGLLDDTLVIWGGEFGRTPMVEARDGSKYLGRDHHRRAFSMWLAGGGIKPGVLGETDELGYSITRDPVSVHDLHATLLALLGVDHRALTFTHQGRRFRLTDVAGTVVDKLVA